MMNRAKGATEAETWPPRSAKHLPYAASSAFSAAGAGRTLTCGRKKHRPLNAVFKLVRISIDPRPLDVSSFLDSGNSYLHVTIRKIGVVIIKEARTLSVCGDLSVWNPK